MLKLLKAYWQPLLAMLVAVAAGFALAALIYGKQLSNERLAFSEAKTTWSEEKTRAANDASAALTAALERQKTAQQLGDKLSAELQAKINALYSDNQRLNRQINDATQQDGATYTGLGPHSLCVYQSALGYADCDQRVQPTASGSVPTARETQPPHSGLPPEDILAHAADYGKWCQQLETQLIQINKYYSGGAK
ncbi:hypothetical protein ACULTK_004462 [Yersinia enterocolitica]|uniref:hypothetical protein n=1 Tax=Yersinia enterocolitica TaxID=630 RepID=UPI0021E81C74|nr:hypothetical protein [Yersinia enterocolitica]EKN3971074.1 hypothetical protein [Yersinia enterocolitica]UYK04049.1 hypothetical protein N4221_14530 [Yersinia enterocolitica]HDL8516378.1 hypothetical protein [Yersinia enterocolitica]HDL8556168.1 hypothetical protein [Yersinia enterocolitica]HDW8064930.1 hypothetical protein [Yersinia enterocolitica]